jgi:hypothetical protein
LRCKTAISASLLWRRLRCKTMRGRLSAERLRRKTMRGRGLLAAGGALLATGVLIVALSLALVVVVGDAMFLASAGALSATGALVVALPLVLKLVREAMFCLAAGLMFSCFEVTL